MWEFINITNDVIKEKLANKIHVVGVEYFDRDQTLAIRVEYYQIGTSQNLMFKFTICKSELEDDFVKDKFELFLDTNNVLPIKI